MKFHQIFIFCHDPILFVSLGLSNSHRHNENSTRLCSIRFDDSSRARDLLVYMAVNTLRHDTNTKRIAVDLERIIKKIALQAFKVRFAEICFIIKLYDR